MFELLQSCGESVILYMGGSFVVGVLFAVFVLLIFDMLKVIREKKEAGAK